MSDARAWVRLPSGKRLDLLNPTPFDWEDKDLALGLARTYRWGGHSAWPLPLPVAQHSLLVLALHRRRFQGASNAPLELRELLHDADEGLLGFDCFSVVKPFLGEAYRTLTARLENVVAIRYGLPPWTPGERKGTLAGRPRGRRLRGGPCRRLDAGRSPQYLANSLQRASRRSLARCLRRQSLGTLGASTRRRAFFG